MSGTYERWKYELTPSEWIEFGELFRTHCINANSPMHFTDWLEELYENRN